MLSFFAHTRQQSNSIGPIHVHVTLAVCWVDVSFHTWTNCIPIPQKRSETTTQNRPLFKVVASNDTPGRG